MEIETDNKKSVKGRIVTAAWQLFEKGYNGTTVDDIIELSGTSKGSFYYYFNTKDELLNTLSIILDDNYEVLKTKMDPDMNCYEKLLYLNYEAHSMLEEKIRAMRSDNKLLQRRLLHAFPNLQPKNYGEQLKAVRESIKKRKKDKSK